jgi:hypothetical protein
MWMCKQKNFSPQNLAPKCLQILFFENQKEFATKLRGGCFRFEVELESINNKRTQFQNFLKIKLISMIFYSSWVVFR